MSNFKKILRGFLDVFAAIVLLAALLVSCFVHGIFDISASEKAVCNEDFYESLNKDIVKSVESFGGVFDIPGDGVLNAIGEDNIKNYTRQYTVDFFSAMYNGIEFEPSEFGDGDLKNYIYDYIRELEPETTEEELEEIYQMVCKSVNNSVKYIPGIIQQIIPSVSKIRNSLNFLDNIEILLYILFFITIGVNLLISDKKKYLEMFYGFFGTVFCVLATAVIPLFMITLYDIPSKLVLEESVLLQFIRGINSLVFVNTTIVTGISLIIVAILLIMVSVLLARKKYKENSQKTVDKIS